MTRLALAPRAHADLDEVWLYIAEDNLDAADRIVQSITSAARLLVDQPSMGVARPEVLAGLRSLAVGNHVLFYRISKGEVRIERILHGRREIGRNLF